MATFEVLVTTVSNAREHPNADRLTINEIFGYTCISNKKDGNWRYNAGDNVCYIGENSVLPEWLLKKCDLWDFDKNKGRLAGKEGNRLRPVKLRGVYSEGLIYPVHKTEDGLLFIETLNGNEYVKNGDDVKDMLGITKYEPVIPESMSGELVGVGFKPVKFDPEPLEKHMGIFNGDSIVTVTEKLHGTFCGITYCMNDAHEGTFLNNRVLVYSKGYGSKGLCFKDDPKNDGNIYVKALKSIDPEKLEKWVTQFYGTTHVHILGEVYGKGVQDLHYDLDTKAFRVFAIGCSISPTETHWACFASVAEHCNELGLQTVPALYTGPYDYDKMVKLRDGKSTLANHVKEGIVITLDSTDPTFGREALIKFVNPDYKLRKNATEYN